MNENILQLFNSSKSFLIVVAKNAKADGLAAALALSIAITKEGKSAVVCSEADLTQVKNLIGSSKIYPNLQLGGDILKISLPYRDGSIDKVTYNITDDRFNLLIEPKKGTAPLNSQEVRFSYTGGAVDLIFTIDAPSLEALGDIYLENSDIFNKEKIINLDRRFDNKNYGAENLVEKQFSSTSEIVLRLLQGLRIELNADIATNLYAGVASATNNFTSFSTNAQTFEVVSFLLRNGAKKINLTAAPTRQSQSADASEPDIDPFAIHSENGNQTFNPINTNIFESVKNQPTVQTTLEPKKKTSQNQKNDNPLKPDIFLDSDLI
jgi:hypothetical protein